MLDMLEFDNLILGLLCISVVLVLNSVSPLVSLLWLLFFFFLNSLLLVFLNLEYLAFLLIIVYAGAVVVLFLFVIMFINMRYFETKLNKLSYGSLVLGLVMFITLLGLLKLETSFVSNFTTNWKGFAEFNYWPYDYALIESVGFLIFDYQVEEFIIITLILFLGLDGVLVLVLDFTKYIYDDVYILFGLKK